MQDDSTPPTPQNITPPPSEPPVDDGVFKVSHSSQADHIEPADTPLPSTVIEPTQDSASAVVMDDQAAPIGAPDLSKIPQSLQYLAQEMALPPEPEPPVQPSPTEPPTSPEPPTPPSPQSTPPTSPI